MACVPEKKKINKTHLIKWKCLFVKSIITWSKLQAHNTQTL